MQTFSTGYLLLIYNKLYDSVLQNALIQLPADHYTVNYNVQQDFFLNTMFNKIFLIFFASKIKILGKKSLKNQEIVSQKT